MGWKTLYTNVIIFGGEREKISMFSINFWTKTVLPDLEGPLINSLKFSFSLTSKNFWLSSCITGFLMGNRFVGGWILMICWVVGGICTLLAKLRAWTGYGVSIHWISLFDDWWLNVVCWLFWVIDGIALWTTWWRFTLYL